jgi:hypothetical protein
MSARIMFVWRRGGVVMPTVQVSIPNPVWIHTAEAFLGRTSFPWPDRGEVDLILPKGYCFLAPLGVAAIGAWGDTLHNRGVRINCLNTDTKGVKYAARLHMFDFLHAPGPPILTEHEESGRFIPLTRIHSKKDFKDFAVDVVPLLHMDSEDSAHAVRYCLEELIRNVIEHAGGAPAYACAQYYPGSRKVSIAVADCGQGLFGSLSGNHPTLSNSLQAAHLALMPGVSGATATRFGADDNAGAGLFFTKTIAKFSGERFLLYSFDGGYSLLQHKGTAQRELVFEDPEHDKHKDVLGLDWPGTLVALDIGITGSYDFKNVLKMIRDHYYSFTPRRGHTKNIRFKQYKPGET